MQVQRGLFRLWLVLSAVWIAAMIWQFPPAETWANWQSLSRDHAVLAAADAAVDECYAKHPGPYPLGPPDPDAGGRQPITDPCLSQYWDHMPDSESDQRAHDELTDAFSWTLGPPVAVLVLGLALGWAFSGFRGRGLQGN